MTKLIDLRLPISHIHYLKTAKSHTKNTLALWETARQGTLPFRMNSNPQNFLLSDVSQVSGVFINPGNNSWAFNKCIYWFLYNNNSYSNWTSNHWKHWKKIKRLKHTGALANLREKEIDQWNFTFSFTASSLSDMWSSLCEAFGPASSSFSYCCLHSNCEENTISNSRQTRTQGLDIITTRFCVFPKLQKQSSYQSYPITAYTGLCINITR